MGTKRKHSARDVVVPDKLSFDFGDSGESASSDSEQDEADADMGEYADDNTHEEMLKNKGDRKKRGNCTKCHFDFFGKTRQQHERTDCRAVSRLP